MSWICRQPV